MAQFLERTVSDFDEEDIKKKYPDIARNAELME
jgi:hypothetical protein